MTTATEVALQIVKDENEVNKKNLFRVMKENDKLKEDNKKLNTIITKLLAAKEKDGEEGRRRAFALADVHQAALEKKVERLEKFKKDAEEQTASFPVVEQLMDEIQDLKDEVQQEQLNGDQRANRLIRHANKKDAWIQYELWSHETKGKIIHHALKAADLPQTHIKFSDLMGEGCWLGLGDLCEVIVQEVAEKENPLTTPYEACGYETLKDLWIQFVEDLGIEEEFDELCLNLGPDDQPDPEDYHLGIINAVQEE